MPPLQRILSFSALALWATGAAGAQAANVLQRADHEPVAITAYAPQSGACAGVAIVSPGAGGSAKGYQYLGEALSAMGYLGVVVGHQESGRRALREQVKSKGLRDALSDLTTDPTAHRGRLMDIAAAKQWATPQCASPTSVLIGHSMGAATTLIEAGALNQLGIKGDDSFAAYIALSPQGSGPIFAPNAWSHLKQPVLLLTGTRDDVLGGDSWQTRTKPYMNMPAGCKWLGIIDGATHVNFAGNGRSAHIEILTTRIIGSFLRAVREGDCKHPPKLRGVDVRSK